MTSTQSPVDSPNLFCLEAIIIGESRKTPFYFFGQRVVEIAQAFSVEEAYAKVIKDKNANIIDNYN